MIFFLRELRSAMPEKLRGLRKFGIATPGGTEGTEIRIAFLLLEKISFIRTLRALCSLR